MTRLTRRSVNIIVLLPSLLLLACSDLFMDEQKTLQLAREYLASGRIVAAAIELRNTLGKNPANAEARYRLASIYLDFGDYESADKEFRRALESGWDEADVVYGQVRSKLGMHDFQGVVDGSEVKESWSAARRAGILSTRALAYAGLGKRDEAFAELETATGLDATSAVVLRTGIQLRLLEGAGDEAVDALQLALIRYPEDPELLLLQGRMLAARDAGAAEEVYRQVINLDPDGYVSANGRTARQQLVQLQLLAGKIEQAEEVLRPLLGRDANDPFTSYLGGVIAFRKGEYDKANEFLLTVLKNAPDHNPTRLLFGAVNYAQKNYEQAAYFLDKYLIAVPDNLVARKLLARSYLLLGRNAKASKVLQSVLADNSNDSELLALAGLSDLHQGKTSAGIAGLEKAVKINPGSSELRSELARAYIEAGETGLAISELQDLLAAGGQQQQTETLLVLAHLRAGDNALAIARVLAAVSGSPDDASLQTLAGVVFAASDDFSEARTYFARALELQPGFQPAALSLAHVEEQAGNYEQARMLYEGVVDTGAESILPMLALARVAEQQGDKNKVREWLERALQHSPADIKPRVFLAEYHLREGKLTTAETFVREALELSPDESALLALSGRIYLAGRKYSKALVPLQALVQQEPASVTGHLLLAETYLQLERYDDARQELLTVSEKNPDNAAVEAIFVRLELRVRDYAQALEHSRRISTAYPELYLGYELAGDSLMAGGKYTEADREYTQAWDRMQTSGLLVKRAENTSRAGRVAEAIVLLQNWLEAHPDDAEVAQFLGTSLQNAGKLQEAMAVYEKVISLEQDNVVALNNLAGLYLEEKRPGALALAERAWALDEDNPGILDTYGWALVQAGQVGRGLQLLKQAVSALPDIPEVRYHHAAALYMAGDKSAARDLLDALLKDHAEFAGRKEAQDLLAASR